MRLPTVPRRRVPITLILVLALAWGAFGADRLAATIVSGRIADRTESYGFTARPGVTVEGFPFLTQLISGRLDGVDLTAPGLRAGPVTVTDVHARAIGVTLSSAGHPATIAHLTGAGLIPFSGLTKLAGAHLPGLAVSAAGPHKPDQVALHLTLAVVTVTAVASVSLSTGGLVVLHVISAPVPSFLLRQFRVITFRLPALPLRLTVHSLMITHAGALVSVRGDDVRLG
ncbi:MAG TPA: DUF2993 domain-containing protein [Streptosporangiaceae bacterium]|nr:DUF2993 domain-containing protein [Streptosporangiaceae bacterium]